MVSRTGLVYVPSLGFGMKSHQTKGKLNGKGVGCGSHLMDKSLGHHSVDEYIATTGRSPQILSNVGGSGMEKPLAFKRDEMNNKIKSMMVKPKVKNIKFSL